MDDEDPTPRHRSSEDRDLAHRKRHRAPALGVPYRDQVAELEEALPLPAPPEDTRPYDTTLSREGAYLNERIDRVVGRAREDSADKVMSALGRVPPAARLAALERQIARIYGSITWGLRLLIGALGVGAIKLVLVVRAFDAAENRSLNNSARIQLIEQVLFLRSQTKDSP